MPTSMPYLLKYFKHLNILNFQKIPSGYRVTASLFCKSATAYNPFIYFFMFKGFRAETRRVLRRM